MSAETDGSKEQFTEFYYNTFDEGPQNLAALYVWFLKLLVYTGRSMSDDGPVMQRDSSMLTFETSAVQGVSAIIEKLTVSLKTTNEGSRQRCLY